MAFSRDFNDIRDLFKKKDKGPFNWNRAATFNERINNCGLIEVETYGGKVHLERPLK